MLTVSRPPPDPIHLNNMRNPVFWTLIATLAIASSVEAQRGGRGGGRGGGRNDRMSQWIRPEQIQERVSVYFNDVEGPATDGEKVADLNTIDMVRAAAAAGQLSMLYLHDGKIKESQTKQQAEQWFESTLFRPDKKNDELATKLRTMHLGRIDVSKNPAMQARYGENVPLFIAFDETGKEMTPVSMAGYKAAPSKLELMVDKAAKTVKPGIKAFAKKYARWLEDYEKLLKKKAEVEKEQMESGDSKAKQIKAMRELKAVEKAEGKLLEKEKKMLEGMRFPPRGSVKIGGIPDRWNRGNNGRGNNGGGNDRGGDKGTGKNGG